MKLCAVVAASALILSPVSRAQQQSAVSNTASSPAAQLQLSQATEAPGVTLGRGSYSIRVADRLQDRLIVQIQKSGSDTFTSLLAYPNPNLRKSSSGPITFASGLKNKTTLRGNAFPGGPVVEFVFPKADAVDLAKNNNVRVMAVDTASEGKVALPNLTQTDMSEVTLWMLTPTPVDPATSKPGIQAARYQPGTDVSPASASAPAPASLSASASPAPSPSYAAPSSGSAPKSAPALVASNSHAPHRPSVKQLPHTASSLPLIALLGCLSFFSAAVLSLRRRLLGL